MLEKYYDKKVYILIDEYDKPVNYILSNGNFLENIEWAKDVGKFVQSLIEPCSKTNNQSCKNILLTGILNTKILGVSSSTNNFES